MPMVTVNGTRLYCEDTGAGSEAVVFSHGLLWSGRMFDGQVAALRDRYRCITYDHRGQGQSELAAAGYDMDTLAEDAAALIRQLGAAPCHFLGVSMGGFIALRLAVRHPELVRSLLLLSTTAEAENPANRAPYEQTAQAARAFGMQAVADKLMPVMFGKKFLTAPNQAAVREEWLQRLLEVNPEGLYRTTQAVINRPSFAEEAAGIRMHTIIMVGDQDIPTPVEKSRRLAELIASAQLKYFEGCGHTLTIEEPQEVSRAIAEFLQKVR
jgi:3-oxoadipate enol-lactonase